MSSQPSNFSIKISPTFTLKRRMRFFANRAMTKWEEAGGTNKDADEMVMVCRFWAKEVLKRKPNDSEAKMYENFPESMPKQ